jgi:hypothetical protein
MQGTEIDKGTYLTWNKRLEAFINKELLFTNIYFREQK